MKYKVLKKFYDPLEGRKIPGQYVNVDSKDLKSYAGYIEVKDEERKPKKKSGDA